MDTHEDGVRKTIRDVYPLRERNVSVGGASHLDPKTGFEQFPPSRERDVEREGLLAAPPASRPIIKAAMTRIEHDGIDFLRILDPARPEDGLDDFAHVHHRDQVFVVV